MTAPVTAAPGPLVEVAHCHDAAAETAAARGARTTAGGPSGPDRADTAASRIVGVDVARGLALVGMMAVHVFPLTDDDGDPSLAWEVFGGRSAALFAMLAGVSLAFLSGGRRPLHGRARLAASAGIAVRALLIALVGFALGYVTESIDVILVYYAVLFLLALPLLGLSPRVLGALAVVSAVVGPVVMQLLRGGLPPFSEQDPTFSMLADPGALASELLLTGIYPALPWMAYFCAGLAIGRVLRTSRRLATRLLVGGSALAAAAWGAGSLLLTYGGGLGTIRATSGLGVETVNDILVYGPDPTLPTGTWWWLAIDAPHSSTPVDVLHTLGTSMAVLGLVLLLTRVARPWLHPLAMAGSMTLTLYTAHVLVVATGLLAHQPHLSWALQVVAVLACAVAWRARHAQGPMEAVVTALSRQARDAVR